MTTRLILAGALAFGVAACAPTTDGAAAGSDQQSSVRPERQCFETSRVDNFRQSRPGTVYLRVRPNEVYQVNAAGGCSDLDNAIRLAIVPDGGGLAGSRVCTGDWARIVVPGSTSPSNVCRVRIEKRLSDEEVAALPSAERP